MVNLSMLSSLKVFKPQVEALFYVAAEDCWRYYEAQLHAPLSRMSEAVILLGRFEVR